MDIDIVNALIAFDDFKDRIEEYEGLKDAYFLNSNDYTFNRAHNTLNLLKVLAGNFKDKGIVSPKITYILEECVEKIL